MKELSLNVLDIVQNSITAGATDILISLVEDDKRLLTLTIADNGCGMSEQTVERVRDPFYTTRTTRKVGMGIPLLRLAAEQAGGELHIESKTAEDDHGTTVRATFYTDNIDFTPVGDMVSTMCVIIQGHPEIDYVFRHKTPSLDVELDTAQVREVLGEGISLSEPEILSWLKEYLSQQYE
ncbi:MAG: sensor histidine kinase [Ruminococcaceae bacterium]|nr:sensor histidine kinase [Oscillospiraceae bacterium]